MKKDGDIYSTNIFKIKDTVLRKARYPGPLPSADSWAALSRDVWALRRRLTRTSFMGAVRSPPLVQNTKPEFNLGS